MLRFATLHPAVSLLTLTIAACTWAERETQTFDADGDGALDVVHGGVDCDDGDPAVHPGAVDDPYDGIDADCAGNSDFDVDGDGHDAAVAGAPAGADDCDDADASVSPDATERCDEADVDEDCDGAADDADDGAADTSDWWADDDGDGFGQPADVVAACDPPSGRVANGDDCDDGDASLNPETEWYADADADGYGDGAYVTRQCEAPDASVRNGEDCDDGSPTAHPGAPETCDGQDNDCDGNEDDEDDDVVGAPGWYLDDDGDGYGTSDSTLSRCDGPVGYVGNADDCDDEDGDRSPETIWYADLDGDGDGDPDNVTLQCTQPAGCVANADDCDDTDGAVNPRASERCNGADDDCDGLIDTDDPTVDPAEAVWYRDRDGDGWGISTAALVACSAGAGYVHDEGDCDDAAATTNPDAEEVCDTEDNDCDGYIDDDDTSVVDASTWYDDADGDGAGDPSTSTIACFSPPGGVTGGDDCDDTDATIQPGAPEVCNGVDDDCDGQTDDDDADVAPGDTTWPDDDGDGYGDEDGATTACAPPAGNVSTGGDCDDADPAIGPGAFEDCADSIDNDCNDNVDSEDHTCAVVGTAYVTAWGSRMMPVAPGSFSMGGGVAGGYRAHDVTLTHDFWIGKSEVTDAAVAARYGTSAGACPDCPSTSTWYQAAQYANALSAEEGYTLCYDAGGNDLAAAFAGDPYACPGYRLPTEAEWEYAARAGVDTVYSGSDNVDDVGWHYSNSGNALQPACTLAENAWGICDMSGNAWEWTGDWYQSGYGGYGDGLASTDPPGPGALAESDPECCMRVFRGGAYYNFPPSYLSVSHRHADGPSYSYSGMSFRLVRSIP